VAAAPGNARAHYYLGLAYARIGIRQGAISHLREAVRLEPDGARFHAELGRAYRQAGEPERALEEFEAAVSLTPREGRRGTRGAAMAHRKHSRIAGGILADVTRAAHAKTKTRENGRA